MRETAPAEAGVTWPQPVRVAPSSTIVINSGVHPARARVRWFGDASADGTPGAELADGECYAAEATPDCAIEVTETSGRIVVRNRPQTQQPVIAVVTVAWYIPRAVRQRVGVSTPEVRATWGWRVAG